MRKAIFRTLVASTTAVTALFAVEAASAKTVDAPCGTAKLIVPWSPGGGTDTIFRIVTEAANKAGADPEIQIVNITGQGGNKGAKEAKDAKPDGCTLFAIHQSLITSYFTGRVDFSWDAFEPVSLVTRTPPIYGANAEVPWDNLEDMIADAKENPGTIPTGATMGSTSHFWYLLLEDATGIKLKYVPYEGTRERMTALLAGDIKMGEINLAAAKKYIQSGELKALGVAMSERHSDIPNVATLKEQGVDLVAGTDRGVVAPKGTPDEIVEQWAALFKQAVEDEAVTESLANKGTLTVYKGPDAYRDYFEKTFAKWKEVAKKVGMYKRND